MCDDIFDDFDEEQAVSNKTWVKTIGGINKDGYRQGLFEGHEESLQEGFNDGFSISARLLFQVSQLRGRVSGKLSLSLMKPGHLEGDQESKLQDLLQDILTFETEMLTFSQAQFLDIKQKRTETSPGNTKLVLEGEVTHLSEDKTEISDLRKGVNEMSEINEISGLEKGVKLISKVTDAVADTKAECSIVEECAGDTSYTCTTRGVIDALEKERDIKESEHLADVDNSDKMEPGDKTIGHGHGDNITRSEVTDYDPFHVKMDQLKERLNYVVLSPLDR